MKSWKTTSAGILTIIGALVSLWFERHFLTPEIVMAAATAVLTGIGLILARDNDKTSEDAGAKPASGPRPGIPLMLLALCGLLAFAPGCANTQNTSGRLLVSTVQTVDTAMQGWWTYEALGHATPDQVVAVRDAYGKYQAAEAAAEVAYRAAAQSGDTSAYQTAADALRAAQSHLLDLVNQFNPPKPPK